MKFNLRHVVFWVTLTCITLAVFRRPILLLMESGSWMRVTWGGFLLAFYDLLWLFNAEGVCGEVTDQMPCMLGFVCGIICSIITHIVLLCFSSVMLEKFWTWCNKHDA